MAKKIKVLITGRNGYLGRSLHRNLSEECDVFALNKQELDLTDSNKVNSFFSRHYFDVVIHCAVDGGSRLEQDGWETMDTNLLMYYNLYNNRSKFTKFIHFGSGAEIYDKESPYGFSKQVIRKSVLSNEGFYNIRIFAVFDEHELETRFIKSNVRRYINKEPMIIHSDKYMDFMYMPDLIKIVKHCIYQNDPKEINCTYQKTHKLSDIANIINNLSEYKLDIKVIDEQESNSYFGEYIDINLDYIGLEYGIKQVYEKLK